MIKHNNLAPHPHSEHTDRFYDGIFHSLCEGREASDREEFGDFIASQIAARDLSSNTVKIYCSAVRSWLLKRNWGTALSSFDQNVLMGREQRNRPGRTVVKHLPEEVVERILATLETADRRYSRQLFLLLTSTLATGLRPIEWSSTLVKREAGRIVLTVKNAKFKPKGSINERSVVKNSRRGNGPYRELIFTGDETEITSFMNDIEELIKTEIKRPWSVHKRSLNKELKRVIYALIDANCLPHFFSNTSIYSFRHQAAANAKATLGVKGGQAAAVLGHASARTAVRSYGRPGRGKNGFKVEASRESVSLVDNTDLGADHISGASPSSMLPHFDPKP